jgi:hypothetical protein
MKALALLTAAALTLLSVAASAQTAPYGKGKAPPPPLLRKASAGDWRDRPSCRSLAFREGCPLRGGDPMSAFDPKRT